MNKQDVIEFLQANANSKNVEGMAKFGICSNNTYGISMPKLRALAKTIKKDHHLALELWETGIHEARIICSLIADPELLTVVQANSWVSEIDSWDVCDQLCGNLLEKTPYVIERVYAWVESEEEFVRRTAFSCIAYMAVHHKKTKDEFFEQFYPLIIKYSTDDRNFVKKAVNWALRQIGKRSMALNAKSIEIAEFILKNNYESKSARWIANDALNEFRNEKILNRIKR